jgi:hypothetical protein
MIGMPRLHIGVLELAEVHFLFPGLLGQASTNRSEMRSANCRRNLILWLYGV